MPRRPLDPCVVKCMVPNTFTVYTITEWQFFQAVKQLSFWKLQNLPDNLSKIPDNQNRQDIFILNIWLFWKKTNKSSFSTIQLKLKSHLPRLAASCSGLSIDSACSATEMKKRVNSNYLETEQIFHSSVEINLWFIPEEPVIHIQL